MRTDSLTALRDMPAPALVNTVMDGRDVAVTQVFRSGVWCVVEAPHGDGCALVHVPTGHYLGKLGSLIGDSDNLIRVCRALGAGWPDFYAGAAFGGYVGDLSDDMGAAIDHALRDATAAPGATERTVSLTGSER